MHQDRHVDTDAFKRSSVHANGIEFHCLEVGNDGPLALCVHGFPDSPWTYRYLLPELANAGYRAIAPFTRGFAPTQVPPDGDYSTRARVIDLNALHHALGGNSDAVLIAHDWGAIAAYGALAAKPQYWRRAVIGNMPHFNISRKIARSYAQIKRSFYFWLFQQDVADHLVSANDLAFLESLWRDWSPNYDPTPEMEQVKACLRNAGNLGAALGYYRAYFDPKKFGSADWAAEQIAVWGHSVPQPTLYIHGDADGCMSLDAEAVASMKHHLGPGSETALVPDVGHFFLVEKPKAINPLILNFLGPAT